MSPNPPTLHRTGPTDRTRREPAGGTHAHAVHVPATASALGPPAPSCAAGNLAVQRLLRSGPIQAKLYVTQPDDPREREADEVAQRVTSPSAAPPTPTITSHHCEACSAGPPCAECEEKEIHRKALSGPTPPSHAPPAPSFSPSSSTGHPLSHALRGFFEPRFGHDFGRVRVHTGNQAAQSARAIQARAFAMGGDVFFDAGQYAPDTHAGKRLLAHELAHVVQQEGSPGAVQRQPNLLALNTVLDPDVTPKSLYTSSFGMVAMFGIDKCSEHLGKMLHLYVLAHPDPYQFIKEVFDEIPSKWEDNVAADFMAQLAELELYRFSQSAAGRDVLDMLYEAMITGDVSGFERHQAARIEQFGLPGAVARRNPLAQFDILANESSPERVVEQFKSDALDRNLDKASETLAQGLRGYIDLRPSPYAFLRRVFEALPSAFEDNVAADFLALMDNARLEAFAAPAESRPLLDILYEALNTGDVSRFQRYEAERIIQVKNAQTPLGVYQEYQKRRRIFPIKYQKFFRDCYAPLRAELVPDSRIKAWYTSVRIWQCEEFKNDVATLGVSSGDLTRGIYLRSDELVSVRLYDGDDQSPQDIPALELINYSNESKNKTLALAQQAFLAGLTLPLGGLPAAGGARVLAIADRFAWGISVVAALVNDNREWIAELPGGQVLLDAVDSVNRLAGYYGWSRLGAEGLRFAGGKLRQGWQAWRAATPKPPLSAAQAGVIQNIERQVDTVLDDVAKLEQQGAARTADEVKPGAPEAPKRSAPGEGAEAPQAKPELDPRVQQRAKERAEEAVKATEKAQQAAGEAKAAITGRGGSAHAVIPSVGFLLAKTLGTAGAKLFAWTYYFVKSRRLTSFGAFVRRLEADGVIAKFSQMSAAEQQVIRDTFTEAFRAIERGEQLYVNQIWGRLSKTARNKLGRESVDLMTAQGRAMNKSTDDIVASLEAEAVPQGRVAPVIEKTQYLPPHPKPGETQVIISSGRIGDPPRFRPGGEGKYPLGRDVGLPGYDRYHLEGVKTVGDELNIVYSTKDFNRRVTAAIENDIRGLQGDLYFEFSATTRIVGVVDGVTIKVIESITWKVQRRVLGTDTFDVILKQTARP